MSSCVETRTDELEVNATGRSGEQDVSRTRYAGRVASVLSDGYETVTNFYYACALSNTGFWLRLHLRDIAEVSLRIPASTDV